MIGDDEMLGARERTRTFEGNYDARGRTMSDIASDQPFRLPFARCRVTRKDRIGLSL
ncbi:hypothetical protein GALL_341270 [mine drainage metagenome]|uniref:Uncharacterized protein n=1 Tax=mine drainage metagenome TaxID=410659 RepID=A0A1J5QW06_9ZZZZ